MQARRAASYNEVNEVREIGGKEAVAVARHDVLE